MGAAGRGPRVLILLALPFGLVIGMVVGAVGGGGAILALPVLVYVLDEPVGPALAGSLIVVAVAAAVGAGALARHGQVCWRLALSFSGPAAIGSLAGALGNAQVSGKVLILAFVPVMLAAAAATWRRADGGGGDEGEGCGQIDLKRSTIAGGSVGVLTGFFGVGGGFVIVPVLTLWFGLGFRRAAATSLVVIALTGLAGLASHILAAGAELDVPVTAALAGATATGALLGTLVSGRLPQAVLGKGFALVVLAVAAFLAVDTLLLGGPPGS